MRGGGCRSLRIATQRSRSGSEGNVGLLAIASGAPTAGHGPVIDATTMANRIWMRPMAIHFLEQTRPKFSTGSIKHANRSPQTALPRNTPAAHGHTGVCLLAYHRS
jgi:hypothetical protein